MFYFLTIFPIIQGWITTVIWTRGIKQSNSVLVEMDHVNSKNFIFYTLFYLLDQYAVLFVLN